MYGHSYQLQNKGVSYNITASILLIGFPVKVYSQRGSQLIILEKELRDAVKGC